MGEAQRPHVLRHWAQNAVQRQRGEDDNGTLVAAALHGAIVALTAEGHGVKEGG